MNKFHTSDITNVILSAFGIKIKSLLLIQYYNSKEKLELSYIIPNLGDYSEFLQPLDDYHQMQLDKLLDYDTSFNS